MKLRLESDGSVTGDSANKTTWRQEGNRVFVETYSGEEVGWRFEGLIEGNRLTGTKVELSNTDRRWKLSLRRSGSESTPVDAEEQSRLEAELLGITREINAKAAVALDAAQSDRNRFRELGLELENLRRKRHQLEKQLERHK